MGNDVTIRFGGDLTDLNAAVRKAAESGKQAALAVQKPMDAILERESKVKRAFGSIAQGVASANSGTEALASTIESMEGMTRLALPIAAAFIVGEKIRKSLAEAAEGADKFQDSFAGLTQSAHLAKTTDDLEQLQKTIEELRSDKKDAGLLERLIFGAQKGRAIDEAEQQARIAAERVYDAIQKTLQKDAASKWGDAMGEAWVASLKAAGHDAEAEMAELQEKQEAELKKAQDELAAIVANPDANEETKRSMRDMVELIKERHAAERKLLDQQQNRKSLEQSLAIMDFKNQMEAIGLLDERKKANMELQNSEEKLGVLRSSGVATEQQMNQALIDQRKAQQAIYDLNVKESNAAIDITRVLFERKQIGKTELEQRRINLNVQESEARLALERAQDETERLAAEKEINKNIEERLKLKKDEIAQEEKLKDIAFQRTQTTAKDDFERAENAAKFYQDRASRVAERKDSTAAEIAEANFAAFQAKMALLSGAGAGPSLDEVAGTDSGNLRALQIGANRGGLNDSDRAGQAKRLGSYAATRRARDPYGAANRARTDAQKRRADIKAAQAEDVLDDQLSSEDASRFRGMGEQEFKNEINQRRIQKESAARQKDAERARQRRDEENPIDAFRRKNNMPTKDKDKGEPETPGGITPAIESGGGKGEEPKGDPMANVASLVKAIEGYTKDIKEKLPQQTLI